MSRAWWHSLTPEQRREHVRRMLATRRRNGKPFGLAAVDAETRRAIGSKGGKVAHAAGTAHRFTAAECRQGGRKGGQTVQAKGTAHCFTREENQEGGRASGRSRRRRKGR
jgi:general stress protein YciG